MNKVNHPFWVIVNKEISDHVKSWRFIILIGIIALTCMGSLYTALTNISEAIKPNDPDGSFLFLKLFTVSDGTLPSFVLFINFLGPLLGIALGFDAVNSEQNKGTLSRMLSQPIHRDCIINAKFVAALIVIGIMLFVLGFLVMGCGLIAIGIPPTAEEFWRIVFFIITSIFYVAFWLNLAILFSLRFRQAATSALASVAVWLFFSVFYTMIVNLVAKGLSPSQMASPYQIISYQKFILGLMRLASSDLSRANKDVRLYDMVERHEANPEEELSLELEAFYGQGRTLEELTSAYEAKLDEFRFYSTIAGGLIGLVIGLALIRLSVKRTRKQYEINHAACVACALCFSYCPQNKNSVELRKSSES